MRIPPIFTIQVGHDSNWNLSTEELDRIAGMSGVTLAEDQKADVRFALSSYLTNANLGRNVKPAKATLKRIGALHRRAKELSDELETLDDVDLTVWAAFARAGLPLSQYNDLVTRLALFAAKAREAQEYLEHSQVEGVGRPKHPGLDTLVFQLKPVFERAGGHVAANYREDKKRQYSPFVRFVGELLSHMPDKLRVDASGLGDAIWRILKSGP